MQCTMKFYSGHDTGNLRPQIHKILPAVAVTTSSGIMSIRSNQWQWQDNGVSEAV